MGELLVRTAPTKAGQSPSIDSSPRSVGEMEGGWEKGGESYPEAS